MTKFNAEIPDEGMARIAQRMEQHLPRKKAQRDTPSIYVGTYRKYNEGSIDGAWMNLDDYADKEEFLEAAAELHKDEDDPELMFQDWENVPDWAISESFIDPKFWEFMDLTADWDEEQFKALNIFVDNFRTGDMDKEDPWEVIQAFEDAYRGEYDSMEDYAYEYVEDVGMDNISNKESYFDVAGFVRDLEIEGYHYVDEEEAEENPEDYPEGMGYYDPEGEFTGYDGVMGRDLSDMVYDWLDEGIIGGAALDRYFDYEKFGRDMELGGDMSLIDGHLFYNF